MQRHGVLLTAGTILLSLNPALAAEPSEPEKPLVGYLVDNSFLLEEAYNQEAGVVQHIFNLQYGYDRQPGPDDQFYDLNFSQEWPVFSQKHQFSYDIPYSFVRTEGQGDNGLGDVQLNYRYQAYFNEQTLRAVAPRVGLILPTGDEDQGLGEDTVGVLFSVPFSAAIGDRWLVHLNAGITYLPEAASLQDRDAVHYDLGAGLNYALTRETHLLVEWLAFWEHEGELGSPRDREFSSLISPGVRHALNFENGAQLVFGIAAPIGLTGSAPDYGGFFYLSFEHFFTRSQEKK